MKAELVRDDDDLRAILRLQGQNLGAALTAEEVAREGFVTVAHSLDELRAMHALAPSVIVRDGAALAGYALTMPLACRELMPVLRPMFATFETMEHGGRPLLAWRFYVMGQICVAREHRGRGVFAELYRGHAEAFGSTHDLVVTEISLRNPRSLRAHARVGFFEIGRFRQGIGDATEEWSHTTEEWSIVAWDFGAARGAGTEVGGGS